MPDARSLILEMHQLINLDTTGAGHAADGCIGRCRGAAPG
jgi:hypothetical protein